MRNERVLFLDIETSPNIGYTWGKYDQNVIQFVQEWFILCFAYKWLGEDTVHAVAQCDASNYKRNRKNDKNVAEALWEVLNEADVVVLHNGVQFDLPKINSRFLVHDLNPPSPYRVIDTVKVARKNFKFNSNKLDDLGEILNLGGKLETGGFDLWLDCMAGDEEAWERMVEYNKQDVALTEKLYLKVLPWITNHPNLNVINNRLSNCPHCQSEKLTSHGYSFTNTGKKRRYQCQDCGAWCHGAVETFKVDDQKVIR